MSLARLLPALLAAAAWGRPSPHTVGSPARSPPAITAEASALGTTPAPVATPAQPGTDSASPAIAPEDGEAVRVLLFGDFGKPNAQQRAVAEMMIAAHERQPFDLAFSLGDNVYDCGLDVTLPGARECRFDAGGNTVARGYEAPRDPRIEERFERALRPFASGPRPLPVYTVLGNHDVAGGFLCREGGLPRDELARIRACLQVAHESPLWRMPGRHYLVDHGHVRFVVIDSNLLIRDYGGFSIDGEVAFVREAVRGAAGRRLFLVAHHPAGTAGSHRDDFDRPAYVERLRRVLEAGGGAFSAWFAGHDHVLQHVRIPGGLDVFVSGNGALARPEERFRQVVPAESKLLFGSTEWGFAVLEVTRSGWSVQFEKERGTLLHCCRAVASGSCEPVACPPAQPPSGARAGPDMP